MLITIGSFFSSYLGTIFSGCFLVRIYDAVGDFGFLAKISEAVGDFRFFDEV